MSVHILTTALAPCKVLSVTRHDGKQTDRRAEVDRSVVERERERERDRDRDRDRETETETERERERDRERQRQRQRDRERGGGDCGTESGEKQLLRRDNYVLP